MRTYSSGSGSAATIASAACAPDTTQTAAADPISKLLMFMLTPSFKRTCARYEPGGARHQVPVPNSKHKASLPDSKLHLLFCFYKDLRRLPTYVTAPTYS